MAHIEINENHVKEQFEERYKQFAARSAEIIERVAGALKNHAPDDWRFTESPSSRFFVIDAFSNAKFMGLSYREGPNGRRIVGEIQNNTHNFRFLFDNLDEYVKGYTEDVLNPDLPIVHHIRTVYPRVRGDIAEEKRLFEETRSLLSHVIPLNGKKLAARPNAVVDENGILWVRQYHNWLSMQPGTKEYYLFHPLTSEGVNRNRCAIFAYSENGKLEMLPPSSVETASPSSCRIKAEIFEEARSSHKIPPGLRSESYWRVPTYLDRRCIDLDFLERTLHKVRLPPGPSVSVELLEFFFLKRIVEKARKKIYR